jgi:hypothetical protein
MEEQRVCVNALKNEENLAVVMQEATRADEWGFMILIILYKV